MIAGITEKEQKIIEHILDKYRKDYAFFYYGSRVKGTYEKTSDLDVLIKGKAEMPLAILQEIKEEFDKSDLPYIVNFSDYYKLDSSFYERIKPDLIPYNWQEVKLGDVCKFQNGYAFKSSQFTNNGNIKIIKIKEIKEGKIIFFDDSASVFYNDKYKKYQVENDDILVALTGDPVARPNPASWVGRIAIFKGSEKALINQRVAKFLPNKTVLFPLFIYYFFRDFNNFYNLAKKATGSASQANISTDMLENTEILLPPLDVQKKIAGVLGALDDKIELNNKINQNLEAQAQALFKSWFVDFEPFGGKMPDDWKIGKFSDIITDTLGGDWGKETPQNNYTEEVSCIRGADIPDVKLGNKGKIPTRFILPKNYTNKKLIPGDLVIEISGGSPTQSTGRIAFISNHLLNRYNRKIICTNFCRAIKPMFGYSEYIYQYWQYLYDKDIFFTYENGTTGIKNLDLSGVLNTESIIIPNKSALMVFSEICNSYFDNIHFNGLEIEHLAELRDSLLPKLMSGEINVDNVKID